MLRTIKARLRQLVAQRRQVPLIGPPRVGQTVHPVFSIMIPATPKRFHSHLWPLWSKLEAQVQALEDPGLVEILVFLDNRRRTIGEKRDALVQISRGRFVAFCDDDDDVAEDYVAQILGVAIAAPDEVSVITFDQQVVLNGHPSVCSFSLYHPNEPAGPATFRRSAWHVCAWRGDLARRFRFPASSYGEDWAWAQQLVNVARGERRIARILHTYRYDDRVSEAPPP